MKSVKLYTSSRCIWCHVAKEFFKENGIKFKEIDVTFNPISQLEMIRKSKQMGVPVIDIDGQIIVGFDKNRISEALKSKSN